MGSKFVFAVCVLAIVGLAMVYVIEALSITKYSYKMRVSIPPRVGFHVFETFKVGESRFELEYIECEMSQCLLGNKYCPGLKSPTLMQISTEICRTDKGTLGKMHCCYTSQ